MSQKEDLIFLIDLVEIEGGLALQARHFLSLHIGLLKPFEACCSLGLLLTRLYKTTECFLLLRRLAGVVAGVFSDSSADSTGVAARSTSSTSSLVSLLFYSKILQVGGP